MARAGRRSFELGRAPAALGAPQRGPRAPRRPLGPFRPSPPQSKNNCASIFTRPNPAPLASRPLVPIDSDRAAIATKHPQLQGGSNKLQNVRRRRTSETRPQIER
jgi:hypothetical protein